MTENTNFKSLQMSDLLAVADYYGMDPKTDYHLLWIIRVGLSLEIPKTWAKEIVCNNDKVEKVYLHI